MIKALARDTEPGGAEFLPVVSGQDLAKRCFLRAMETERLSHAYLFVGPEGSGKRLFARELAKALLCRDGLPCGRCSTCRSIDHDNHPGVTFYRVAEGKTVVDIETVRSLCERTHYRSEGLQIAILEGTDVLSEPAANAVLKTLEEPPEKVLLILLAQSAGVLQPTIVSRCHRIPFVRPGTLSAALSREQLDAFEAVREPGFYAFHDPRGWLQSVIPDAKSIKGSLRELLDALLALHRGDLEGAGGATLDDALRLLEALLELREDLDRNVQSDLVLERLIRRLRSG